MQLKEKREEEENLIIKIKIKLIIIQKNNKMNLKELKKMIAEEYSAYTEQAEPAVDVAPGDIDAGGEEDSEETLQQIYDMLKDYFEGGNDDAGDDDMAGDKDGDGDVDADDMKADDADDADDAEALQERFKKLANIIKG
jgi:hypothetical protein